MRFDAVRNNLERDKRARQFNAEQLRLKLSGVSQSVTDCSKSMAQQVMRRSRQSSFFETWSSKNKHDFLSPKSHSMIRAMVGTQYDTFFIKPKVVPK